MIDKTILHYKLTKKLGEGGMGVVYLAEDTKLDRQVAIKFLPAHISRNSDERKRFEIEARAAAALNHPNITTIFAIEEAEDEMFIVMEYIDGVELREKMNAGPLALAEAQEIAVQIAGGLEAAHEKNIIHRDIKSTNIMITSKGQVKIMDFGLAKVRGAVKLTREQSTIGTAAYMSPQQAKGEDVDQRSDIWSFGVVLYEMLAGKLPFKGDYDQAVIYSILNEIPNFDADIPATIPAAVRQISIKSLQKRPEDRYQNMAVLVTDLLNVKSNTQSGSAIFPVQETVQSKLKIRSLVYMIAGAFILLSAVLYFVFSTAKEEPRAEDIDKRKMIVVLPFENLGRAEDEFFADGLAEEITSRLASFPELGVIARTSAIQYKNTNKKIDQIGEELKVEYVLEGTIRWDHTADEHSRVRVTQQLIRVADATHLWADRFDKVIDDIFTVQSDIAEQVIAQLNITLLESGRKALRVKPTENIEAYTLFLRAREQTKNYDEKHVRLAIQLFEQAIALDPDFSEAISYLSQAHSMMFHFGYERTDLQRIKAKEYAEKALKLAPDDADSHIAKAYYHYWVNREYDLAENEFSKAEKFQPNNAEILAGRAFVQRRQGRWEESISNLKKSIQLNPLDAAVIADMGYTFTMLRRYAEAVTYYDNSIQTNSNISYGYASKWSNILLWHGDLTAARAVLSDLRPDPNDDWSNLVWIEQLIYEKNYEQALDLLEKIPDDLMRQVTYVRSKSFFRGWIFSLENKPDMAANEFKSAITFLENKIQERSDDFRLYAALGLSYAALGEKEKAIEFGTAAAEMYSDSLDALDGSNVIMDLAWNYTLAGEYEHALQKLDYLLSIPSLISVSFIRIDPRWEPLRSHPEYNALIAKYSGKN